MATPLAPVAGTGSTGSSSSTVKPASVMPSHQTGDLLIAQFDCSGAPTVSTPASGWSTLRPVLNSGSTSGLSQFLYYKVAASSSETAPSFTMSTTSNWTGNVSRYRNVDVVANLAVPNSSTSATSGTSIGWGTLAALDQPNCMHVFTIGQLAGSNGTLTANASYTALYDIKNSTIIQSWMGYHTTLVGPGTLSAATTTASASVRYVAQSFVLRSTEYATFRAGQVITTVTASSIGVTVPSGLASGDIWVAQIYTSSTSVTVTPPVQGGTWNALTSNVNGTTIKQWVFWKRAVSGETTNTFTISASTTVSAASAAYYRGTASGSAFDVLGSGNSGTSTTMTELGITPASTSVTLLGLALSPSATAGTITPDASMFERLDSSHHLQDAIVVTPAATGNKTATQGSSVAWSTLLVGLLSSTSVAGSTDPFPAGYASIWWKRLPSQRSKLGR